MKDLFDPIVVEETKHRIQQLSPESARQWGTMTVAQTLSHCTSGIEMAMGTLAVKRAPFPASLIGKVIKPLVFRDDKPMRRNSPSAPELFTADPAACEVTSEQFQLIAAIENFACLGQAECAGNPHPFFGPLSSKQWAILMYKHVDHHLRQFGA